MYILAIETTGPFGSAALIGEKGRALGFEVSKDTMSHLKDLIPMIDRAIKSAGIGKDEISVIAASTGPGSFTGIRIGVSTARALAQALGIKAVSVPTLDSFLFKEELGKPAEFGKPVAEAAATARVACPIINARRGQVYGMVEGYLKAGPYMLTDVLEIIENRVFPEGRDVIFLGDGIEAYEEKINDALKEYDGRFCFAEKEYRYQDALSVGRWALDCINRESPECLVDYEELLPEYMRKAEAEQKLAAGELPICKGPKQE